jgi:hypothetical protein
MPSRKNLEDKTERKAIAEVLGWADTDRIIAAPRRHKTA